MWIRNVFPFFVDFIFQTKKKTNLKISMCSDIFYDVVRLVLMTWIFIDNEKKTTQATSMNIVFFILSKEEHIVSFSH